MRHPLNTTTRLGVTAAALAILSGCASGPGVPDAGQTFAGVELDGRGSQVRLAWAPNSMVARSLRPGTSIDIVASYATQGGRVSGELASDAHRIAAGAQGVIFNLTPTLKKVPEGPVCLQLRVNRRQALPLRVPSAFTSSDEFHYAPWSDRVSAQSRRKVLADAVQRGQRQLQRAQSDEQVLEQRLREKLRGASSCAAYRPDAVTRGPSRNVIAPSEWAPETERECTHRFVRLSKQAGVPAAKLARIFGNTVLAAYTSGEPAVRALRLVRVVDKRLPEMDGYQTRLSSYNKLPISAEAMAALNAPSSSDGRASLTQGAQGVVDAFDSCLREVLPQFRSAYESWQAERDSGYEQELASTASLECTLIEKDLAKAVDQRREVETQIAGFESEAATLSRAKDQDATTVYPLLGSTCPASW